MIDFDSKGCGDEQEELADYCAGMYLLDPFYQAACAGIADGLHSLESLAPDQFQHSEYYLSYFRSVVGGDELQFMVNVDGAVLGLSLGRSTRFSHEEHGRLLCVRDWVLAAMRRHLQLLPPQGSAAEAVAGTGQPAGSLRCAVDGARSRNGAADSPGVFQQGDCPATEHLPGNGEGASAQSLSQAQCERTWRVVCVGVAAALNRLVRWTRSLTVIKW